jgi:hypothetical protein
VQVYDSHMLRSVDDLVGALVDPSKPAVFFVGSYVSTLAPAYLPTAKQILNVAVRCLAPFDADETHLTAIIDRSLPESYYGLAVDLLGKGAMDLWSVLDYEAGEARRISAPFRPTASHHALVHLAHSFNTPLVTPNYDRLFEKAAEEQGLPDQAFLPEDFRNGQSIRAFSIWKVHGTLGSEVFALLPQITRSNAPMLRELKETLAGKRLILAGYSGRDIDVFPYLMSWTDAAQEVWWLDPSADQSWHMAQMSNGLRRVDLQIVVAGFSEFCAALESRGVVPREVLKLMKTAENGSEAERQAELARHEDKVQSTISAGLSVDDPKRRLLYVQALHSVGLNSAADQYQRSFQPSILSAPYDRLRYWICRAQIQHELAQFVDCEASTRYALAIAKQERAPLWTVEPRLAAAEARRMQVTANYVTGSYYSSVADLVAVLGRFWYEDLRCGLLLRGLKSASSSYQELRAVFAHIEHRIRLGALFQGLLKKARCPKRLAAWLMRGVWHRNYIRSVEFGYAGGVANQSKFAERLGIQGSLTLISPKLLYGLLSDETGLAIWRRDDAEKHLRAGNLNLARQAFKEAASGASSIGDPSLELKAYVGLAVAGGTPPKSIDEIEEVGKRIQGAVHKNILPRLLATIKSSGESDR